MKYRVDTVALKKIMVEKGFETIVSLEKASGVNRMTISGIINEEVRPSTKVIEKLMIALNISPELAGPVFFAPDLRIA